MINSYEDDDELEWGEVTPEQLLRKMYRKKRFDEMNDSEIDKMLEDLI